MVKSELVVNRSYSMTIQLDMTLISLPKWKYGANNLFDFDDIGQNKTERKTKKEHRETRKRQIEMENKTIVIQPNMSLYLCKVANEYIDIRFCDIAQRPKQENQNKILEGIWYMTWITFNIDREQVKVDKHMQSHSDKPLVSIC